MNFIWSSIISLIFLLSCNESANQEQYDVVVLGAGTGAVAAAIQSARSGAETILVNPQPWLGGMLTSAGVSATDGNHKLHAGLWAEWRGLLRSHYGGPDSLFTGWVSNTMFEPHIGEQYWRYLAKKEKRLTIYDSTPWGDIKKLDEWLIQLPSIDKQISGQILIDGTDLGDVAAQVGVGFDLGMDSHQTTGESMAPETANEIIQDFTYAAILKDYGPGQNKTIEKPLGYRKDLYDCSCQHNCDDPKMHPCDVMLNYGKLPNQKYMINWPFHGNDYYANMVNLNQQQRDSVYQLAKEHTLGFVYYIQTELGFSHLGLADDEFPTADRLALMPYHREGRRIHGITQLTINHILNPFDHHLYKTGIAVGDYPIDHHHGKHEQAPDIAFPSVPSFSVPIGAIIPKDIDNFLIADKAMSVTNIVNGASRLQPVIIQVGQAAGLIAAMSVKQELSPQQLNIRKLQQALIDLKGYIMPYIDVSPEDSYFNAIQRIGSTGILKGRPVPYKWANQTWFDPDSLVVVEDLKANLIDYDPRFSDLELLGTYITQSQVQDIIQFACQLFDLKCQEDGNKIIPYNFPVTRAEFASELDLVLDPFGLKDIDFDGSFLE